MGTTFLTASSLKAILCFIDPTKTPKIAAHNDAMALPLIEKIKHALGDRDGSQSVSITFTQGEEELANEFHGISKNIQSVFTGIEYATRPRS